MEEDRKLPALRFCNKSGAGEKNPEYGDGALGNQFTGRMFFAGSESDKKIYISLVQQMLLDLGYNLGPKKDDGKFGDATEKAVNKFQKEHEDWHGDALKVDGLVGPETADALNRAMVGVEGWYEVHQTEKKLTIDFALLTVTFKALKKQVPFDVTNTEKGKVIIKDILTSHVLLVIKLVDIHWQPIKKVHYKLEIDDSSPVEGYTDDEGILSEHVSETAARGKLTLKTGTFSLFIVPDTGISGIYLDAPVRLSKSKDNVKNIFRVI